MTGLPNNLRGFRKYSAKMSVLFLFTTNIIKMCNKTLQRMHFLNIKNHWPGTHNYIHTWSGVGFFTLKAGIKFSCIWISISWEISVFIDHYYVCLQATERFLIKIDCHASLNRQFLVQEYWGTKTFIVKLFSLSTCIQ